MARWINEEVDGWMDEDGWMDGWMGGSGWMDGWWTDGWTDGRTDGWTDEVQKVAGSIPVWGSKMF